ncbi:MAG: hypothetical protein H6Q89_829 [Myxococcaceae bacterium]|nr:hypothetical protein [Myxococcaceae bacterium]
MGLIGDFVNKAKSYVPKIELPKISIPNPVALAQKATHAVQDTFTAATKPLVQLASVIPNKAPEALKAVTNNFYKGINAAADKLGGELKAHGSTLEKAGKLLDGFVPFAKDIQTLGQGAKALGTGIADAPENAVALSGEIADRAINMGQAALGFVDQAKKFAADKLNDGVEAVKTGVGLLEAGAKGIAKAGAEYVQGVADAVDYKSNIDKLGEGDKYKLGVGASGSVEGIKIYGKGSIEVEKKDGGYVVSVDGELGGGIYGEVGGKLGAKVNAEASATLGLGGKVEMKFATAEDAKKATEILLKQAAASAAASQTGPLAIPGQIASRAIQPSADELKFLAKNVSAVELRGNVAGELAGTLGIKDVAGINAGLKAKGEVAARIEFTNPPSVTIKQTLSAELAGSAGLRLTNGKEGSDANTGGAPGASGKIEAKAIIEQKYTLPGNVDTAALLKDPGGYIKDVASKVVKSEEDKITLELDAQGGVLGSGGGAKTEITFKGKAEELRNSGYLEKILKGDVTGALTALGDKVEVEAKVTPYKTLGLSLAPGVSLMGFGVGVELEATRQDMADQPLYEYKGKNATETAQRLAQLAQQYSPYLQTGPVLIRG